MKYNLRLLRPLLFLTALMLLTNCQDDYEEHHNHSHGSSDMKIVREPFEYFEKLPDLINTTVTSKGVMNKVVESDIQYDFNIDSTTVIEVTSDKGLFYTMAITRPKKRMVTFSKIW